MALFRSRMCTCICGCRDNSSPSNSYNLNWSWTFLQQTEEMGKLAEHVLVLVFWVSFGDDKRCGSKRKGKAVSVTPPTQVSINKKRPKPVEKVQAGGPQDNMSNIDINVANPNAFVGPNYTTEIENDFVRHGYIYRNDPVNMDGHNTQWMYGSIHEANNLPRWDQVPNHSVPMFTPFPLGGNFPSHSQTLLYHGRHSVPPNTPFMGALEEVERSAKMARNMNGNDGSSFKP